MFPNDAPDVAVEKLRGRRSLQDNAEINVEDPVSAWKKHDAGLQKRAKYLNEKRYSALKYRGPGTDFTLGMADDHVWMGGGTTAGNGLYCVANMPTEEVFSMPHKDRADGTVTATKAAFASGER